MSQTTPKVIACDVDGTLTKDTAWDILGCIIAKPNQRVIDYVNELAKNNFIVIYTARRNSLYEATVEWLNKHGVTYHAIRMEKMPADFYLDDKMIDPKTI
jgi:phosphatidate phosphatase PAH1